MKTIKELNYPFVGEFDGKDSILIRGRKPIEYNRLMYWRPIERR